MKGNDLVIVIMGIIMCIMFFIIGWSVGDRGLRQRAITEGVAHYTVNSTNGIVTFEFKKPLERKTK